MNSGDSSGILAPAVFLTWAMVGCGQGADPPPRSELTDSAGVTRVHSHRDLWEGEFGWQVIPRPFLTVGSLDGSQEEVLVEVVAGVVRPDGGVVVSDRGTRTVRWFGPGGRLERTLGGPGDGPGEFKEPGQVLLGDDGSVAVWDQAALRLTRFGRSGELSGVETLDWARLAKAVDPPLYPGRIEPLAGGGYLVRLVEKSKHPPSGSFRSGSGALVTSADLGSVDTLAFFPDQEPSMVEAPFGPFPFSGPGAPETVMTHVGDPPRICVGDEAKPEVTCFGPGEERLLLSWEADPGAMDRREVEAWRDRSRRDLEEKLGEDDVRRILDELSPPEEGPFFGEMVLDREGNLWVRGEPVESSWGPAIRWRVFNREGRFLGWVRVLPVQVLEVGRDFLLGVHRDPLGVEYIQLFRLTK